MKGTLRTRALFTIMATLLMALTLGGVAGAAPNPNADSHYPDLPKHDSVRGQFYGATVDTLAFAPKSQQYVKIDDARMAFDVAITPLRQGPGQYSVISYPARAYAMDGTHDDPRSFGAFPDTRVRTVAFGAVPVEATIHVSQLRDDEGLLVPLALNDGSIIQWLPDAGPRAGQQPDVLNYGEVTDSHLTGPVEMRLSDVTVDGVSVDVGPDCRPVAHAQVSVTGEGFFTADYPDAGENNIPPGKFHPYYGGVLTGTIDVPSFAGCGTDDLGPLLSAMVSGKLPVKIYEPSFSPDCFNDVPGSYTVAACPRSDLLQIPARPK